MKILIIGNGFIAKSIIQKLETKGHQLLIFSRSSYKEIHSRQVLGDIFLFEDFLKTLHWQPQVIINTAWITSQAVYRNDPSNRKYAQFTSELARFLVNTDVEHYIVLGTCSEYGIQSGPSTAVITKLSPKDLYSQEKVKAFNSSQKFLQGSKVRMTWARIFQPYGPQQDANRLIPYLVRSLRNGEKIQLSDTTSIHDWITTSDIASAISWLIENKVPTEVDVGTTIGYSNVEVLRHLEDLLSNTTQWAQYSFNFSGNNNVSLVGKESPIFKLGWRPKYNLNAGLEHILSSSP